MPISRIIVAGAAGMALSLLPARAQDFPSPPLPRVVPFAAGGPADVLARIIDPRLSALLGQQVIVENMGGAGGISGSLRVAKAAPHRYQFVMGDAGPHPHK